MNRNCYRIIFNKARGMLMVVADIARSGRAGASPSSRTGYQYRQCGRRVCAERPGKTGAAGRTGHKPDGCNGGESG
ncbi:hypothetical protein GOH07_18465 [Escherichia coli]|nr:hypothetical protein [Escherichia coli]EIH0339452.1 ESPR domain-containing protein [Escherichia coli O22]EFA7449721.1 hypothetical protein [Escherichia coli]EFA7454713.1 hypothetical protein [Escherichia coli]EFH4919305.1 hypothetical protein [Escherichia coli]